jgi:hypothetical protein
VPRENQKTVTVSGKALETLQDSFRKELRSQPSLKFASFIADNAIMELERKNMLKEASQIALIGLHEDTVVLKDYRKREKFIEVQIRNGKLYCLDHESSEECIHVGFALALPEVRLAISE